ncbi:uncharacterized protein [Lepeophtheirus salmonis]|uniref:uncharacterized protein n=1 Tax=Lepeophtheirus salmonis TaxID=72036 RepID=UPI001AE92D4A|nr:uncharacterized protein LOC121132613 [Lepeophtheirus salmonis]
MVMPSFKSLLLSFVLFQGVQSDTEKESREMGGFGGDFGQYMNMLDTRSFKPGRSDTKDNLKSRGGFGDSLSLRSFPGMGDGMIPGLGKRSFTTKRNGNDKIVRRKTLRFFGVPSDKKRSSWDKYTSQSKRDQGSNQRRNSRSFGYRESGMGDFGGDYGKYMKMMEDDQISENQDLQADVFGGGMSGKYWDIKGSMGGAGGDMERANDSDDDKNLRKSRQSLEEDQPEDAANESRSSDDSSDTYIVAFKSPKEQIVSFYNELKTSMKNKDKMRVNALLDSLNTRELSEEESLVVKKLRKIMIIEDDKINDHKVDDVDTTEMQDKFEEFVDMIVKNVPDPIKTRKGIPSSFKSLSITGFSSMKVTGKVKKLLGNRWRGTISLPSLITTITSAPGPGVPFNGKVIGVFKYNHIHIAFRKSEEGNLHVISVKINTDHVKFIPKFDSSIPLNPWSKVSMSSYLVSRIKKYVPNLVDKTFLKLAHIVEKLGKDT